ncbi:DNA-directed RNA polymerase subunit omega [Clavibacter michiganensis]|uniref:DNA-directed RNA polymerase subunit omega n=1 Tax=Clavibacter michiganensis TaxID=28447 RepID=UPI00292EA028|nr:DNA-directed RNA polymerase subunit omega [Clavibacter michiganensis]
MAEETEQLVEETENEPRVNPEIDSKYRKIILAAQRSKQLQRGANPRVDMDPRKSKATRIAMKELEDGKVDFELTQSPIVSGESKS